MRRPTKKLRRSLLVVGTSAALLSFGGANALADNTSTQSSKNSQILPIGLGVGVSAPLNVNVPLLGGGSTGPVNQTSASSADSSSKNAEVSQTSRQNSGNGAGDNTSSQTSKNNQVAPIAISGAISAPINVNAPIGLLSPGANEGRVNQRSDSEASSRAVNAEHDQDANQANTGGRGSSNDAKQVAVNNQLLPIALGLGISAPVNVNAPIAVLSPNANRGDVNQRTDSDAHAEALNNETEQSTRQRSSSGGSNSSSQTAISNQLLPIAAALAAAVPVNVNAPIAVLSPGANNGDVDQMADSDVYSDALNNETDQNVDQKAANGGTSNTADQKASNTQLLPVALGAGLGLPVNARAPIAVLAPGSNNGDVRQKAEGDVNVVSTNNRSDQDIEQRGSRGNVNSATQDAVSEQLLPIAAGLGAAVPANAVAPIAVLDHDANNGDVRQHNETRVDAESINNDVNQSARQEGGESSTLAVQSASANASDVEAVQAPASGPVGAEAPVQSAIPVSALTQTIETLTAALGNPLGLVKSLLGGL